MKKSFHAKLVALVLVLSLVFSQVGLIGRVQADDSAGVTDPNLLAALIEIGADTDLDGDISQVEMGALSGVLLLGRKNISTLYGLEYLSNITFLELDENPIIDYTSILDLDCIENLWLNDISTSILQDFSRMANLIELKFERNGLVNITPINNLTGLQILRINGNNIADIAAISALINLQLLDISDNPISDFTPISNLSYLNELFMDSLNINDLSTITFPDSIWKLNLNGNNIDDITPITNLTNLQHLGLSWNNIDDYGLRNLSNLQNLRGISMEVNPISDASLFNGILNLEWLNLESCNFMDARPFANITNLQFIDISSNYIDLDDSEQWIVIQTWTDDGIDVDYADQKEVIQIPQPDTEIAIIYDYNLRQALFDNGVDYDNDGFIRVDELNFITGRLDFNGRGISDLTGMQHAENLEEFHLGSNNLDIGDINLLSQLVNLRNLSIFNMELGTLEGVQLPVNIEMINVEGNNLTSIATLLQYNNINHIWAGNNELDDNAIANISDLSNLGHITLSNNKISSLTAFNDMDTIWTLEVQNNEIEDLTPLLTMDNLTQNIIVQYNYIDLTDAAQLSIINTLQSRCNNVEYEPQRFVPDPSSEPVVFEDDNLRVALIERGADYYPDGTLTEDELRAMTGDMDLWGTNVSDFTGIRYLENITGLNLGWNYDADYNDVFYLAQLENINMNEMGLSSLIGFDVFTNLRELSVSYNNIADISPIKNLINLEQLSIIKNRVLNSDGIADIGQLTSLWKLNASENSISDISVLLNLSNLNHLELNNNSIQDISPLINLLNLNEVWIQNNYIDLSDVAQLNVINTLNARCEYFEYEPQQTFFDPEEPSDVVEMENNLRNALINQGVDYNDDGELTVNEMGHVDWEVNLSWSNISNLSGIEYLVNTKRIDLDDNNISDITPLINLTNLEVIGLRNNSIQSISGFENLTNLGILWIENNELTTVLPIANHNMWQISISNNKITSIDYLAGNVYGGEFYIHGNFIDISEGSVARQIESASLDQGCEHLQVEPQRTNPEVTSPEVVIPDGNFRQVLIDNGADYNNDDKLTQNELGYLTGHINFGWSNITDISGIEWLNGVSEIYLDGNQITNLALVGNLQYLRRLDINHCGIDTLEGLQGLTNLENLYAGENNIVNVTPLANLDRLWQLTLYNNKIESIDSIVHFSLGELRIENNFIDISEGSVARNFINRLVADGAYNVIFEPQLSIPQPGTEVANIPDANLMQALFDNGVDYDGDGVIRIDELNYVTWDLGLWDRNITDLTGLEHVDNANCIDLNDNPILNFDALAGIERLGDLWLCNIPGLSDISELPLPQFLGRIGLGWNGISDISRLTSVPGLNQMYMNDNNISDISCLASMTGLDGIYFENNNLTDISVVSNLTELRFIRVPNNEITSITALQSLPYLEEIEIQYNQVNFDLPEQVAALAYLQSLNTWFLEYEPQVILPQPETPPATINDENLEQALFDNGVDYDGDGVIRIDELNYFTGTLMLWDRGINDLTGLEHAINTEELHIGNNQDLDINDINLVSQMLYLKFLALNWIGLGSLDGLQLPSSLERIDVQGNNLTSITPLFQYNNINHIWAGRNEIYNNGLYGINNLNNLGHISLDENNISDVSMFTDMDSIWTLEIQDNNIIDITPLLTMDNLRDHLFVQYNQIDLNDSTQMNVINTLIGLGTYIEYEPQVKEPQQGTETANIPDGNLVQALFDNGVDVVDDGVIRIDELNYVTWELNFWDYNITDLTGVEHLINVPSIELGHNQNLNINELSKLTMLSNLYRLFIPDMGYSDISMLPAMPNLTSLNIGENGIADISRLAVFPNLHELLAENNHIEDISVLVNCPNLTWTKLRNNNITDITVFSNWNHMDGLFISQNNIDLDNTDQENVINYLQGIVNNFEYEPQRIIPDPNSDPVILDENLRWALIDNGADYYDDGVLTHSELSAMTGYLDLYGRGLTDLAGLEYAVNVEEINLGNNWDLEFDAMTSIEQMTNLKRFWFNSAGLTNLEGIRLPLGIEFVSVEWNDIMSLKPLTEYTNIREIYAGANPLDGAGLEDFYKLFNLYYLNVSECNVDNIAHLTNMDSIEHLDIYMNIIQDITPLATMGGLQNVIMFENCIDTEDETQINVINSLIDNGVNVDYNNQKPAPPNPNSPSAGIVDQNLNAALIDIGLDYYPDGVLTQDELNYWTRDIWLVSKDISDLNGLQYLQNINRLGLIDNPISDITPLIGLTQLLRLDIETAVIDNNDLSVIANLTNLTELSIRGNGLIDISSLQPLVNIQNLYMENNGISDISVLGYMPDLVRFYADNNLISNISVIKDHDALQRIYIRNNRLTSLLDFTGMETLQVLFAEGNYVNLALTEEIGYINTLITNECELAYSPQNDSMPNPASPIVIIPDANLKQELIKLNLDYNSDGELSEEELSSYKGQLRISYACGITDLTGLEYMTELSSFSIANNDLTNIASLQYMDSLSSLNIRFTTLDDITPISRLTGLETLSLINCGLPDVSFVSSMTQLVNLNLTGNPIEDVTPLSGLANLEYLSLWDTDVASLDSLENLDNLQRVYVVGSLWDISALAEMDSLTYVNIGYNFLDTNDDSDDMEVIRNLEDRGVTVRYHEQTSIEEFIPDPESSPAGIVDDNIRQALINRGLDYYPDGTLTKDELRAWTSSVWLSPGPITDLTGLQFLINARTLNIVDSPDIVSFDPILGLDNLRGIYLSNCGLENADLNQFMVMDNLTYFFIPFNNLTDIGAVVGMDSLEDIDFSSNSITDISALANMPNLTRLSGDNNLISSMAAFFENDRIQELRLGGNRITTAAAIATMTNLRGVKIEGNLINLTDIDEISYLSEIEASIQNFDNPYYLYEPQVTIPDPGSDIVSILDENLKLALLNYNRDFNEDSELSVEELATFTGNVQIYNKDISNLEGVQYLINVTSLNARTNDIIDISMLGELAQLEHLNLGGNNVTDATIIENITNLQSLILSGATLEKFPDFSKLTNLESLILDASGIEDISFLENLDTISFIRFSNNKVTDISVLLTMDGLTGVYIPNNFLDISEGSEAMSVINTLLSNGVYVTYEPQRDPCPDDDGIEVYIPDPNLRMALLDAGADYYPDGYITDAELEFMTGDLNFSGYGIVNLEGIQYLTGITSLELSDNLITDVSKLAGMTQLEFLNLSTNYVVDASPLTNLNNLTWLGLMWNRIVDITGFGLLTNLESLLLRDNSIENIAPISTLNNLTVLNLHGNELIDISALDGMSIQNRLYIAENYIDVSEGSAGLTILNALQTAGTEVYYEPQYSKPVEASESAGIVDNNLKQALIAIGADYYGDGDISRAELAFLKGELWFGYKEISDLTGMQYATGIDSLVLSYNPLDMSKVGYISNLTNLTKLSLVSTGFNDMSILSGLSNLTYLSLQGNGINNIIPLAGLTQLEILYLGVNEITDITGLQNMLNLVTLDLTGNTIENTTPLVGLDNLEFLDISANKLTTVGTITDLDILSTLNIQNNFLDLTVSPGEIDTLQTMINGGVSVTYDPQMIIPVEASPSAEVADPNLLQALIDKGIDLDNDGDLSQDEMAMYPGILNLSNKGITDLVGLSYMTSISDLNIDGNLITDLTPLAGMSTLEGLMINNNPVSDITPVGTMTSLLVLEAANNNIQDLTPLENITGLLLLHISNNRVTDISSLAYLPNLTYFFAAENGISDLSVLYQWYTLDKVDIDDNFLELSEGSLTLMIIDDLIAHGVEVLYGPQMEAADTSEEGAVAVADKAVSSSTVGDVTSATVSDAIMENVADDAVTYAEEARDEAAANGEPEPEVDIVLPEIAPEGDSSVVMVELDTEPLQLASDYDIGLVVRTDEVEVELPSSALDTADVAGISDESTMSITIEEEDVSSGTTPVFTTRDEEGTVVGDGVGLSITINNPDGSFEEITTFVEPVEVTIQLTDADLEGITDPVTQLEVYWYDPDSGTTELMEGATYNASEKTMTFTTTHFSTFIVVEFPKEETSSPWQWLWKHRAQIREAVEKVFRRMRRWWD